MTKVRKTEVKQIVTSNRKLYRVDGNSFKHKETTKDIVIRLFNPRGGVIEPDQTHKWSAQVASLDKNGVKHYQGQYPVKFKGINILIDSEDLTELSPGDYELEIWETYTDDKPETTIYPSPGTTIPFHIDPTVPDSESEQIKQLDIQDVINLAVIKAGQNLVIDKINTLPTGSQASVKQEYKDGKNVVTLNISAGPQGLRETREILVKEVLRVFEVPKEIREILEKKVLKGFKDLLANLLRLQLISLLFYQQVLHQPLKLRILVMIRCNYI